MYLCLSTEILNSTHRLQAFPISPVVSLKDKGDIIEYLGV